MNIWKRNVSLICWRLLFVFFIFLIYKLAQLNSPEVIDISGSSSPNRKFKVKIQEVIYGNLFVNVPAFEVRLWPSGEPAGRGLLLYSLSADADETLAAEWLSDHELLIADRQDNLNKSHMYQSARVFVLFKRVGQ